MRLRSPGGLSANSPGAAAGDGEAALSGIDYADPHALAKQATQGRMTFRSTSGGDETAGFTTWRGHAWTTTVAGPFKSWMLTRRSNHLWRADLPADLPIGVHQLEIKTTDRYDRSFTTVSVFEVVEALPEMGWRARLFE